MIIVSGQGTKDSPILLDDDSESEVVTELIGSPSPYPALLEDSELTPRLSPRPGTFLSNVAHLNLSKSSAQTLKKYRQDLRQRTHDRKRKRALSPSPVNGGPCLVNDQPNSTNIVVEVVADSPKCETEVRQQPLKPREKPPRVKFGRPAKKPKHTHKSNNERMALPDLPAPHEDTTTYKTHSALGPTPCPNAPWPIPNHSRFPDPTTLPSPMASTSYPFDSTSLPLPTTAQDLFNGQLMPMTQEPFPIMNVDFDPVFWAMSMSMNGFAMSSAPIPPIGIPLPPKPMISEKQKSKLPLPPSKSFVKSESKHQLASSKSSIKLGGAISEQQPPRPPNSNDKFSISRQRPFTLRPEGSMPTPTYVPIGKPDFRDIHGVFPIITPLMFPAPLPSHYIPALDRTLVLENLPKQCSSSKVWIQNWCLKACGLLPELILLGPRRALVVFKQAEHAIDAWASPKLGVDENGVCVVGAVGGSKLRLDVITAYWYRPDAEKERQLATSWSSSKRIVAEIKEALQIPMNESAVAETLTGWSDAMLGLCQLQQPPHTYVEPRLALQRMADEMGLHEKVAAMEAAFIEEDVLRWEQKEIALIERERRAKYLPHYGTRQSEVEQIGDEERKIEADMSALRSITAQSMLVSASRRNQRNVSSISTAAIVDTDIAAELGSMSELPSAKSSILPAKPQSLQQPPPSSSSASRIIPPPRSIGLTAGKTSDFMISSSSKPPQTRIHPNHSLSVNPSEKRTSNLSAPPTASTSTKHTPALRPSPLPSSLPAKPRLSDMPSCDVAIPPGNLSTTSPIVSPPTTVQPSLHSSPKFPGRLILGDRKEVAEPQERSRTVSSAVPVHISASVRVGEGPAATAANTSKPQMTEAPSTSKPRDSTAKIPLKPVDSSGSIKPQPSMLSNSVPVATSESSVTTLKPGKAVASISTRTLASSLLTLTPVMAAIPGFGEGISDRPDIITDQSAAVKAESRATLMPQLTLVSAPRSPPVIPLRMLQELKRVLAKSIEERQNFLDNEFKATRLLMDRLMTITCKKERRQATDLWKQKIRVIDEVTRSIRNDAKVWYSQETKTWIRMRWPDCLDTSGILVIGDGDDDDDD